MKLYIKFLTLINLVNIFVSAGEIESPQFECDLKNKTEVFCTVLDSSTNVTDLSFYVNYEAVETKVVNETTIFGNFSNIKKENFENLNFSADSCTDDDYYIGPKRAKIIKNFTCEFIDFQNGSCAFEYSIPSLIKSHELWSSNKWFKVEMKNISDFVRNNSNIYQFIARRKPGWSCDEHDFYCAPYRYYFIAFQINGITHDNKTFCARHKLYAPKFTKLSPPSMVEEISVTKNSAKIFYKLSSSLTTSFPENYKCSEEGSKNGSNDLLCYVFRATLRSCNNFTKTLTFYYNTSGIIEISNLTNPFAWYEMNVSVRMDRSDFWSESYTFTFKTAEDIPKSSPKKLAYNMKGNDLYVFWEPINKCDEGGRNLHYDVTINNWDARKKCSLKNFMMICKKITTEKLLTITIQSRNDMNVSKDISQFKIILTNDSMESQISMEQDYNTSLEKHVINFKNDIQPKKLFWCETKSFVPNECDSALVFLDYNNWDHDGLVDKKSLIFGATLSSSNVSEIVWSTCKKLNTLKQVSEFKDLRKNESVVELGWTASCEHFEILKDYLLTCECQFLFNSTENCTCPEVIINKNVIKYNYTNLNPFASYTFEIFMRDDLNNTSEGARVHLETIESEPSEVKNIKVNVSDTSVDLSWDPPKLSNGILSGYKIYFQKITEEKRKFYGVESDNRSYTAIGLAPDTKYYYWIEACTRNGKLCSKYQREVLRTEVGLPGNVSLNTGCDGDIIKWDISTKEQPHFFEVEINGVIFKTFSQNYSHDARKVGSPDIIISSVNVRLNAEEKAARENGSLEQFRALMEKVDCTKRECKMLKTKCTIQNHYPYSEIVVTTISTVLIVILIISIVSALKIVHKKVNGLQLVLPSQILKTHANNVNALNGGFKSFGKKRFTKKLI